MTEIDEREYSGLDEALVPLHLHLARSSPVLLVRRTLWRPIVISHTFAGG